MEYLKCRKVWPRRNFCGEVRSIAKHCLPLRLSQTIQCWTTGYPKLNRNGAIVSIFHGLKTGRSFTRAPDNMALVQDRGAPSAAAMAIATGIIGLVTGYFVGQGSSIGLFGGSKDSEAKFTKQLDDEEEEDDEDDELEDTKQELSSFTGSNEECKLVLVVRTDLRMSPGKTIQLLHVQRAPHSRIRVLMCIIYIFRQNRRAMFPRNTRML